MRKPLDAEKERHVRSMITAILYDLQRNIPSYCKITLVVRMPPEVGPDYIVGKDDPGEVIEAIRKMRALTLPGILEDLPPTSPLVM